MRRVLVLAAAGLIPLAGCGSGSSSALSTRDFAEQANAVCRGVDASLKKVPRPAANDLASLVPYAQGIETAYASYLSQVSALAAKAQARAAIEQNWTTLASQDFAGEKPLLENLVAAAQKKDAKATAAAATALQRASDHTGAIQAYQATIGATDCSTLLTDIGR